MCEKRILFFSGGRERCLQTALRFIDSSGSLACAKIKAHPQTSGDAYCKFPGVLILSVCEELALLRTRIKTRCWDEGKLFKSPAFAAPETP